jgi:Spy/CpxP family protein refolding chaperone
MKKNRVLYKMRSAIAVVLLVFAYSTVIANNNMSKESLQCAGCKHQVHECLKLTDEQKTKIDALRLVFIKEVTPIHNDIEVKQAMLKAASTGDAADVKKANQLIDEISQLKASIAKKKLAHKQEVRKLLTEEQKVIFDSKAGKANMHRHAKKEMRFHGKSCCQRHGGHGSQSDEGYKKWKK